MNELELLRPSAVFATVVEEGSFRGAADRLGLSAPYVSQLVADLETRLGRQLLYRSTRKLALSSDGERYLPVAQQIARALDDGLKTFRSETKALAGQLRLSVPTVLAAPFFAGLVAEFQSRHPALELSVLLDDQPVDPLDRQTDLAIRIGGPGTDTRPARRLFVTEGIICTSATVARSIQTPDDLSALRWIKTPAMGSSLTLLNAGRGTQARIQAGSRLITNNGQMTAQLIAQDAGWAIFPAFAVRGAIASGQMVRALPDWCLPDVGVYGLYSSRKTSLSNARSFVDFLAANV